MHSSQCTIGFSRKSQTQCLWNGVEISLGLFTPSNGRCTTKICTWCVHGFMIQKMKKLMLFWTPNNGTHEPPGYSFVSCARKGAIVFATSAFNIKPLQLV
jgi:hypothetical protein